MARAAARRRGRRGERGKRMMSGRRPAALFGAALVGLLVAGCAGGAPAASSVSAPAPAAASAPVATAAPQTPRALTPVAVHNFARTVSTAIIGYAAERGFAGEEGLDVALQEAD